ncbi:transposase [Treponema sp. HNW]|uniref:transposase n=1 Tax=Treponema sp. HNW TaxID=3116654 RepID=UPI003D14AD60
MRAQSGLCRLRNGDRRSTSSLSFLRDAFHFVRKCHLHRFCDRLIESLNFSLRKVTRNKSSFPDDDSIYKVMYLAIKNASAKWTMPIKEWGPAVNQFAILFEGRFPLC